MLEIDHQFYSLTQQPDHISKAQVISSCITFEEDNLIEFLSKNMESW